MASVNVSDFHDLCRICGNKTSVLMGLHIFEREGELRQIHKKITECLPIKVLNSDKLPKMVCEECVYKLDLLYDFRENSLKTDIILKDVLKGIFSNTNSDKDLKSTIVVSPLCLSESISNTSDSKLGIVARSPSPAAVDACLLNKTPSPLPPQPQPPSSPTTSTTTTLIISNVKSLSNDFKNEPDILIKVEEMAANSLIDSTRNEIQHQSNNLLIPDTTSDLDSVSCCDSDDLSNAINDARTDLQEQPRDVLMVDMKQPAEKITATPDASFPESNGFLVQIPQETQEQAVAWFFCNICGKTFSSKEQFNVHYEVHWNKCHECGAIFTDEEALAAHCKQVHTKKTPQTTTTDFNDVSADKVGESDDKEEGGTKKQSRGSKPCPVCGKTYRTNYKLNEHMRRHTGEKPYKCCTCDKAFRSKIGLAQHEAQHTGQYDYTCDLCGKGFQCKSYLAVHQRVHSDAKPYTCATCARHFKTKQSLLDHENRHLGVKPYLCETCGRGFITKGLCKSHQRVHSGGDNRQHPCGVCNKLFVSKSYLATHARIHTGEKPFICEVCGKGFLTRVDLRIHSTVHTGEKSFVCEMCGKAFARRDALRCHRRSHTGERPYRCDVCGQSFTQFSPMAIHRRLHTGERPYACDICSATFVSRSTMLAHRKKHNADAPNPTPTLPSAPTDDNSKPTTLVS